MICRFMNYQTVIPDLKVGLIGKISSHGQILIREQSLSLTGTGAEGNQQGYGIFLMKFAGV